jgi:hypothetical protein
MSLQDIAETMTGAAPPRARRPGRAGPAEKVLDQQIHKRRQEQNLVAGVAGLCKDPRWEQMILWADTMLKESLDELVVQAGDPAMASRIAGRIEVLKDLTASEDALKLRHQRLQAEIQGLQEQRAEAQTKDVMNAQPVHAGGGR